MASIGVRQIPIELVMLAIGVGPRPESLGEPAIIGHGAVDDILILAGDFPVMVDVARRPVSRVGVRAIVGVANPAVPQERVEVPLSVIVSPEECRVETGLLSWICTPDVRDAVAFGPVDWQPVVLGIRELEAHGSCNTSRTRKVEAGDSTLCLRSCRYGGYSQRECDD